MSEEKQIDERLYRQFQDWRVNLYQAIANHSLSYERLDTLAGDLRQALERVETEIMNAERSRHTPS
jgi:hypothetical protein